MKRSLLGLISFSVISFVSAKDCGVIGTVYPIAETDLRVIIQQRLSALEANGTLARFQTQWQRQLAEHVDTPASLNLPRTVAARTHLFNPAVRFPTDVRNALGEIVIHQGAIINPLDSISLDETLVFYDGADPIQVKWLQQWLLQHSGKNKLILVGGSLSAQEKALQQPMYFDQQGRLSQRLGITHVPALVSQQGKQLKINEVVP